MACQRLRENLTRKKPEEVGLSSDSLLRRCLTTIDLTSLGVGTIVGAGLYVVTGELARDVAGPSVVLSFLLAAISGLLCASFYAEFACRIPKAGSSYIYTYVALGEIWAFIVGWNILLEYIIATASLARACSEYINALFGEEIYRFFMNDIATWNHPGIAPFPDLLAFGLVIAVVALVCVGTRLSANVQKVVTAVNFLVIFFIIIYGLFFAQIKNWTNEFAPYGTRGVLQGAASAFYAFSGFDVVTTAAEEAINPQTNIPLSLILVVTISAMAYFGVATVLTLMLPYQQLDPFAPLVQAFTQAHFTPAKFIITIGGIFATISALVCGVFSSSRIIYSMSLDGLLFRWFSHVDDKNHTPIRATIIAGCVAALLAMIFDIKQLVSCHLLFCLACTLPLCFIRCAVKEPITFDFCLLRQLLRRWSSSSNLNQLYKWFFFAYLIVMFWRGISSVHPLPHSTRDPFNRILSILFHRGLGQMMPGS